MSLHIEVKTKQQKNWVIVANRVYLDINKKDVYTYDYGLEKKYFNLEYVHVDEYEIAEYEDYKFENDIYQKYPINAKLNFFSKDIPLIFKGLLVYDTIPRWFTYFISHITFKDWIETNKLNKYYFEGLPLDCSSFNLKVCNYLYFDKMQMEAKEFNKEQFSDTYWYYVKKTERLN